MFALRIFFLHSFLFPAFKARRVGKLRVCLKRKNTFNSEVP